MQGNVAYISTDPVRPRPKAQPHTQTKPIQRTQVKPQAPSRPQQKNAPRAKAAAVAKANAHSRRGLISTLFVLFVAFCALSLLISRYAVVCAIGGENNKIEQNIAAVEKKIEDIKVDMELRDNIEYLQSTAEQTLDMAYPTQDQKITINMSG